MGEPEVKYGGIHMAEYCELFFRDLGYEQSSQRRGGRRSMEKKPE